MLSPPKEEEADADAQRYVEGSLEGVAGFSSFDGLAREGGECGEGATNAYGEHEHVGLGAACLADAGQEAEEKAADNVDNEGTDGHRKEADVGDKLGDAIAEQSAYSTSQHYV